MAFKKNTSRILDFSPKVIALYKGYWAEQFVRIWFWIKQYQLLHHRWLYKQGEIDLIFLKDNTVIFVEVKFRTKNDHLPHALSFQQQQRLKKGILAFQQRYPSYYTADVRFDVVWISLGKWPIHFKNVW